MATQSPGRGSSESDRITFEVDTLQAEDEQVLVTGRWYGVRGRRFFRPTLTLYVSPDGGEHRALASLDHKPWAAEDGESWTAAFTLSVPLEQAEHVELSVAPDITVILSDDVATATASRPRSAAPDSRSPRVRGDRVPARPATMDRRQELDRMNARLDAAERAHQRERERREEAERSLEEERNQALSLRSEVGRLRAELDLAAAARQELAEASTDLESTRARLRDAERQVEHSRSEIRELERQVRETLDRSRDGERALKSAQGEIGKQKARLSETGQELERTEQELAAAVGALNVERAESQRLRSELEDAELAVRRLAHGNPAAPLRSGTVGPAMPLGTPPGTAGADDEDGPVRAPGSGSGAGSSVGFSSHSASADVEEADQRLEPMSPRLRALNKLETSSPPWAERPINPSLQPADRWLVRGVAVVVVILVVLAVVLIIAGAL